MAKVYYPAFLDAARSGGFGVVFPDLPGCVSFGETAEEAAHNASEALALALEGMAEDGDPIPEPSPLGEVTVPESVASEAPRLLVSAEQPGRFVKANVTFPSTLLERIDKHVERHGMTRASFLANAARRVLDAPRAVPESNSCDLASNWATYAHYRHQTAWLSAPANQPYWGPIDEPSGGELETQTLARWLLRLVGERTGVKCLKIVGNAQTGEFEVTPFGPEPVGRESP